MATILFAWELGGGLGHIGRIRPVAERLVAEGHRVVVAAAHLPAAGHVSLSPSIELVQAPLTTAANHSVRFEARSFAELLWHAGFQNVAQLALAVHQWQSLFDTLTADLVVADHAPTALLALRERSERRVVWGTGFCCPPIEFPLRDLRPWLPSANESLVERESQVLRAINEVLAQQHLQQLSSVAQLYQQVDDTLLTTYPELDHYANRDQARYWGVWSSGDGALPRWPEGHGPKLFAYVKPDSEAREALLAAVGYGCRLLVFDPENRFADLASPQAVVTSQRLDLAAVGATADLALGNATHALSAQLLLSGVPLIVMPRSLEQWLLAQRLAAAKLGVALLAQPAKQLPSAISFALSHGPLRQAVAEFSSRYRSVTKLDRCQIVADHLSSIASNLNRSAEPQ